VRIVYVASLLTYDGVEHIGRSLTRHFQAEHDIRVVGAIAAAGDELHSTRVSHLVFPAEDLDTIDVVYMEGGWTDGSGGVTERFPLELAETYVRGGGQLIVADVDRNAAVRQQESLRNAMGLFGAYPSTQNPMGAEEVLYLSDQSNAVRSGIKFVPSEMWVSDNMEPALEGVDSLVAAGAIALVPMGGDIAATGNRSSTRILAADMWVDGPGTTPWAVANTFGDGHAVLIGGWFSHDINLEDCPDNARWLSNLMTMLSDRSRESRQWAAPLPGRHGSGATDLVALLSAPESEQLERKSSFLVATDPARPIDRKKLQHAVGKSIAALANTSGGHVIIGQADDKTVLGLANDFAALGPTGDQDAFTQALIRYTDQNLSHRYEVLGLKTHWINHDGHDVVIVEVPKQPRHIVVEVKHHQGQSHDVYVRRGTQSDPIERQSLIGWIQART